MNNWNPITKQPPDELVEVMDDHGFIGRAYPTIYPFRVTFIKGEIKKCKPYWDGGWLIDCSNPDGYIHDRIIKWRELQ